MIEIIECRDCESKNCDGCNVFVLSQMLNAGKFDSLMDKHHSINPAADVSPVKHGRWIDHMVRDWRCSECGEKILKVRNVDGYCYDDKPKYCPNCGSKMDEEG